MKRLGERHPDLITMVQGEIDGRCTPASLTDTGAFERAGNEEK